MPSPYVREVGFESAASRRHGGARAILLFNVVVAAVALAVFWPFMLVLAALIRLTSPGPAIYSQLRVGLDRRNGGRAHENWRRSQNFGGRPFRIYKFRTMRVDADGAGQVWAVPDDPRVTRVGRFLRHYRLDELPQLWNVLRGEMSIVGPRPEQPEIALALGDAIRDYRHRHRVPPGITGWAQVNQAYDQSVDDVRRKVMLDLEYVQQRSLAFDIRIMCRTLPVILARRGAV